MQHFFHFMYYKLHGFEIMFFFSYTYMHKRLMAMAYYLLIVLLLKKKKNFLIELFTQKKKKKKKKI